MSVQVHQSRGLGHGLETAGAWLLGALWVLPLAYAVWTAFHPGEFSTRFVLTAPVTLGNFSKAWSAAPFALTTLFPRSRVLNRIGYGNAVGGCSWIA